MRAITYTFLWFTTILLALTACTPSLIENPSPEIVPTNRVVTTRLSPNTPIPPLTAKPSSTIQPTHTPTLIVTPTITPRPTSDLNQVFLDAAMQECEAAQLKPIAGGTASPGVLVLWKPPSGWTIGKFMLPFTQAHNQRDVRTLVCVYETRTEQGKYDDGQSGYKLTWKVRLVDYTSGNTINEKIFSGGDPPRMKLFSGPGLGDDPDPRAWIYAQMGVPVLPQRNMVSSIAFSPDGLTLAVGESGDYLSLWIIDQLKRSFTSERFRIAGLVQLSYSADGSLLGYCGDATLKFIQIKSGLQPLQIDSDNPQSCKLLAFSPDNRYLAIVAAIYPLNQQNDGAISIYDLHTGSLVTRFSRHTGAQTDVIHSISFSSDSRLLAVHGSGWLTVNDATTGHPVYSKQTSFTRSEARGSDFSPDGRWLAFDTSPNRILVVHTSTWEEVITLSSMPAGEQIHDITLVNNLLFSPDSQLLAAGMETGEILLWRTDTWERVISLEGHMGGVNGLAFSPDGAILASGSSDKTVFLWDITIYYPE